MRDAPPRLLWILDGAGEPARLLARAEAALAAGLPALQLRAPTLPARALHRLALALRERTRAAGAALYVNDRVDVALASGADGVQLREDSLDPASARRLAPRLRIGVSVHDPAGLAGAANAGADFALLAPVWTPAAKPDASGIGPARAAAWIGAARLPVLLLGGITPARLAALRGSGAAGIAVMSAIDAAVDPGAAVRELLAGLGAGSCR
jgi:thiamine-phosphate diphosphorylase